MPSPTELHFKTMPSPLAAYPKAILVPRPATMPEGETVPRIVASIEGVRAEAEAVSRYCEVCGFKPGAGVLPITYPHVLASPLHIETLASSAFPVRLMGLVHVSNTIVQHQPVAADGVLDIECEIEGHEDTERGQEFELITRVRDGGQPVWEEVSRFLARGKRMRGKRQNRRAENDRPLVDIETTSWLAGSDIGRRYARVSGDYNPIHLSLVTARLLGFPRAIAQGMWSMARSIAEITERTGIDSARIDVEFKMPLLLPGWVMLRWHTEPDNIEFRLRDAKSEKRHLAGFISKL